MTKLLTYRGTDGWPLVAYSVTGTDDLTGRPPIVLLHGGGPDHRSLVPLARRLANFAPVLLPDVRGYGRSGCADPKRHAWDQYTADVLALLDHAGASTAFVGGAGLGGTIALRLALHSPQRIRAVVVMSLEDIEDDFAKAAEIKFMDDFANRVREFGLAAAWDPVLPDLAPVIASMVREAIPRADATSIAAAAAIGRDRSFGSVDELAEIKVPTLLFPGMDWRHPQELAEAAVRILPRGRLAELSMIDEISDSESFAAALSDPILHFLSDLEGAHGPRIRSGAPEDRLGCPHRVVRDNC